MNWLKLFMVGFFLLGFQSPNYAECVDSWNGEPFSPRPFQYGDLVISKSHGDRGIHFVTECEQVKTPNGKTYWKVHTIWGRANEPLSKYSAPADDFYEWDGSWHNGDG